MALSANGFKQVNVVYRDTNQRVPITSGAMVSILFHIYDYSSSLPFSPFVIKSRIKLAVLFVRVRYINSRVISPYGRISRRADVLLEVHKSENFFGFAFEFCSFSFLVMLKY